MKRGDNAREFVKNTIISAFEAVNGYVCIQDKKIYVEAEDAPGGERIQFAISMTMPKNRVSASNGGSGASSPDQPEMREVYSLSDADFAKINELKERLGVIA